MEANVSVGRVTKCLWHRGRDLKAERAPQPDRRCIGFDNRIELHRPVAIRGMVRPKVTSRVSGTGQPPVTGRSIVINANSSGYSAAKVTTAIFHRRGGAGGA
jgi:3-keto-L-gulonate-6-phosphate decarboxylase